MTTQINYSDREKRLLGEIAQMRNGVEYNDEKHRTYPETSGDLADQANHTIAFTSDLTMSRLQHELLAKLEHALDRLKQGKYGICEICGKKINPERLDALPYTCLCIECSQNKSLRKYQIQIMEYLHKY